MRGCKIAVVCGVSVLTACSFAPKYAPPPMLIPPKYKESGTWVAAKPSLPVAIKRHAWWSLFKDPVLTQLEKKVTCGNESLKVALARYEEASAIALSTRSQLYPTIIGQGSGTRQKNSGAITHSGDIPALTYNLFMLTATLNYELDAWGSVRNSVVASDSLARASEFDLASIDLSMHAALASDYFELRGDEAAQKVLDRTVVAYKKALDLTRHLHKGGAASEIDVDQAITQYENARTLSADLKLKRAQFEHAIAVLIGEIPANFYMPPTSTPIHLVTVSPALPSTLLERRPDIAAAEQRVKAANATIGVARAAFFPVFNLSTMLGYKSNKLSDLVSSPRLIWALGPASGLALTQPEITQVIFDGYDLQALLMKAKAGYFEAVSAYKQTVLTAFQGVEDSLVAIRRLDQENKTQTASTVAAERALYQANQRYQGGIATYLDVIVTENEALQSELALITIHTRRQLASVQLIKTLGGGWCR